MELKSATDIEVVLATLSAWESAIDSEKLQQLCFLTEKEIKINITKDYVKLNNRPFSESLLRTLDFMQGFLLLEECMQKYKNGVYQYFIEITDNGREFLKRSEKNGNGEIIQLVMKNIASLKEKHDNELQQKVEHLFEIAK